MTARRPPETVVVVGGGIVGLLTAYYLQNGGVSVTVVERDRIGEGCSWGNLGWICPSICSRSCSPDTT